MNAENRQSESVVPTLGARDAATPTLDDPRYVAALEEYLMALEAGQKPSRQAFLARHAEIADGLAECLDGMEILHEAGSSTDHSADKAGPTVPAVDWQPGTPLGDFRIIREIGRGGMGVVYEAEQLSLHRRIALKVLPFALTLDSRQLERFKNEARGAAHLHHQNIVPIYSVGCERGVHFYAMQYIEGQTLAEVIHQLRQASDDRATSPTEIAPRASAASPAAESGDPRRSSLRAGDPTGPYLLLSEPAASETIAEPVGALATAYSSNSPMFFRAVAALGVQAAGALEHAHEYGVVHRDVKPGNLMMDAHGHLWVTDFGLAQFQTDAGLTLTGDLMGTLRYMSPEQAMAQRGLVDHRTDIYSLGATLYELLVLEPVFTGHDREQLLHQIAFDEPRPLRRHNPSMPADLETIVLKALSKRVEDRYATAQELADDLRRFLEQKPIMARRPTFLERTVRWSRRHKAMVVTAVMLLILATVGFAASTALIAREEWKTKAAYQQLAQEQSRTRDAYEAEAQQRIRLAQEQSRTREAYEAEAKQRTLAEENYRQARRAIDFFAQFSEEELAHNPGMEDVRRRLLETALDYYRDFLEQHHDDPSIQAELAASQARVSQILTELSALQGPALMGILLDRNVQDDLNLSPDQKKQLMQVAGKPWEQPGREAWGSARPNPEEWRARMMEPARSMGKSVLEILSPEQKDRFKQIVLQVQQQGRFGFSDPEVVEALKLTSKQRERMRKIQNEAYAAWADQVFKNRKGKKPPEFWTDVQDRINEVLAPAQREQWRLMTGKPVVVNIHYGYPFDGKDMPFPMWGQPGQFGNPSPPGGKPEPRKPQGPRDHERGPPNPGPG